MGKYENSVLIAWLEKQDTLTEYSAYQVGWEQFV